MNQPSRWASCHHTGAIPETTRGLPARPLAPHTEPHLGCDNPGTRVAEAVRELLRGAAPKQRQRCRRQRDREVWAAVAPGMVAPVSSRAQILRVWVGRARIYVQAGDTQDGPGALLWKRSKQYQAQSKALPWRG